MCQEWTDLGRSESWGVSSASGKFSSGGKNSSFTRSRIFGLCIRVAGVRWKDHHLTVPRLQERPIGVVLHYPRHGLRYIRYDTPRKALEEPRRWLPYSELPRVNCQVPVEVSSKQRPQVDSLVLPSPDRLIRTLL